MPMIQPPTRTEFLDGIDFVDERLIKTNLNNGLRIHCVFSISFCYRTGKRKMEWRMFRNGEEEQNCGKFSKAFSPKSSHV
jgi:hypothetical protein